MFTGLLSACTTGSFDRLLVSNSKEHIKCLSSNNRPCQATINSNEPPFYPLIVSVKKSGGSCHAIDDPYSPVKSAK